MGSRMSATSGACAYPYTSRDLLEQPERYMYSDCFGEAFVRDYLAARRTLLEELTDRYAAAARAPEARQPDTEVVAVWEALAGRSSEAPWPRIRALHRRGAGGDGRRSTSDGRWWDGVEAAATVSTEDLLRAGLLAALDGARDLQPRAVAWLDRFVRQFEVTRRLHARYTAAMKPTGEEFGRLTHYALLSLSAVLVHERTGRWPLLNAALKLNDLLCSCQERLCEPGEMLLTMLALWKELQVVSRLAATHEVLQ